MAEERGFQTFWRTLNHPNYRNYMAGNFVSQMGLWTQRIAVQWITWELTGSTTWLGIIAFADFFPIVVMAPLAGAYADRIERLRGIRLFVFLSAILSTLIAGLVITDLMTEYVLLVLVFLNGTVLAFNYPFRLAIIHQLVGREALTSAISINSVGFNIARIAGPALAGALISFWGVGPAVIFTVIADVVFIATLYSLRPAGGDTRPRAKPAKDIPREIKEGFAYAIRHPGIAPLVVVLTVTTVFGRPLNELLAGFSDAVFGMGVSGLAWLTAMYGVGGLIGCIDLACYSGIAGLTRKMIRNVLFLCVAVIGFVATDNFWIALGSIALLGYAMAVIGVVEQSLMQASIADEMRGRIMSLYSLISRGCPGFGALLMGYLASFEGLRLPVGAGAILCLAVWIWVRRRQDMMAAHLEKTPEDRKSA
jgi:MFS family permease